MKQLLTVTAVIEVGAGLAMLVAPTVVVQLLLGPNISGEAISLGRLAGVALLALGIACWVARGDAESRAARGLVIGMLVYNIGAVGVFGAAGSQPHTVGIALWPVVILHAVMAIWCISLLLRKSMHLH
jgi:hypothetical protein